MWSRTVFSGISFSNGNSSSLVGAHSPQGAPGAVRRYLAADSILVLSRPLGARYTNPARAARLASSGDQPDLEASWAHSRYRAAGRPDASEHDSRQGRQASGDPAEKAQQAAVQDRVSYACMPCLCSTPTEIVWSTSSATIALRR